MFSQVFKNIFNEDFFEKLNEHQKNLDELTKLMIKAMKELSAHGWYFSANTGVSNMIETAKEVKKGNFESVDKTMKTYYDTEFDSIINELGKLYPEREKVFLEAAKAHKSGMYFASTTLFISQADGICNGHLYVLKNEKKNLKKEISKFNNPTLAEFLDVIVNVSAIDAPYSKDFLYPSKLNRHAVIHGLDFNYGTDINSLKAFSLLSFVGDFFNRYRRRIS